MVQQQCDLLAIFVKGRLDCCFLAAAVHVGLSASPLWDPWLGRPWEQPWEDAHACLCAVALVVCCLLLPFPGHA